MKFPVQTHPCGSTTASPPTAAFSWFCKSVASPIRFVQLTVRVIPVIGGIVVSTVASGSAGLVIAKIDGDNKTQTNNTRLIDGTSAADFLGIAIRTCQGRTYFCGLARRRQLL